MPSPDFVLTPEQHNAMTEAIQAKSRLLGEALRQTPEFQAFMAASRTAQEDDNFTGIYRQIKEHESALVHGRGNFEAHQAAYQRLIAELEALPVMQAYHQALQQVQALFNEVDSIISASAGVPFAVNAQKSCCG